MHFAPFAALTAVVAVSTGCAAPADPARVSPVSAASRVASTSAAKPVTTPPALTAPPANATRTGLDWATAYCGWSYAQPNGSREQLARSLMTPSAGSELPTTAQATWDTDVVGRRQVATCTDAAAHVLEGPQTETTVYLLITADRTIVDGTGSVASSPFVEPRRLLLTDGRWLVDARVEGG